MRYIGKTGMFFAIAVAILSISLFTLWVVADWTQPYWPRLVEGHFAAIIGLPLAAVCSFAIVVFLKQTSKDQIEFEGIGFKFKGPSGEVVLWLMCYIGITLSIKMLW